MPRLAVPLLAVPRLAMVLLAVVLLHGSDANAQQAPAPAQPAAGAAQGGAPVQGTAEAAALAAGELRWERVFYSRWEGAEVLLHNSSVFHAKLALGDLDGDGDPDLLIGKQDGRIDRFQNTGSPGAPRWRLVEENVAYLRARAESDTSRPTAAIEVGAHAAPTLVDIDQDGDLDLFVGTGDGRLLFFRNIGNPVLAAFSLAAENFLGKSFGNDLVPQFADVDRNRSPDLFVGNRAGEVFLLVNQGTQRRAAFCVQFPARNALPDEEPPCRPTPVRVLSVAPENNAAPGLVDWDGDGDLDLFVGKSNGTIAYYENKGTGTQADWRLEQERFLAIDDGGFAAPGFLDTNGDGRPDMLVGSSTNNVPLYTYKDTNNVFDVWKIVNNALAIQRMGLGLRQVLLAAGDLDGDKDLDLLVGERGGRLLWLENVGTPTAPAWRVKNEHLLAGTVRENVAPWLVDLDGDGDLDLLLGGQDGQIWLMRNVGTVQEAQFKLETANYAGIDVGNDSVPALRDIDGDGDLDLFVGNRRGLVIFYRNEGSAAEPNFQLVATNFGAVNMGVSAAPGFFDWNADGKPDLVVGSRKGLLTLDENQNEPGNAELNQWKILSDSWASFRTTGYSAPHFADLNGDGKPDLLIGDADGNVQLWYNRGPRVVAAQQPGNQAAAAGGAAGGAMAAGGAAGDAAGGAQTVATVPIAPVFQSQSGLSELAASASQGATSEPAAEIVISERERLGPLVPIFKQITPALGGLEFKGRARPAIGDLNGDGRPDLVVGVSEGRIAYYVNESSGDELKWREAAPNLGGYDGGANPSPLLYDLNGDGLLDLIVGSERGPLLYFQNTGNKNAPVFTRMADVLAGINVGRSAAPAVGLVNGDQATDLIVGDFSGQLWAFVREGGAQSLNFKLANRRYLGVDVGVAATPFVGDIDRDGLPELLIGSDQGRIRLFTRAAGEGGGWKPGPEYFQALKFPFGTTPRLVDIDGDGDLDLITGSEKGTLYFFRNEAIGAAGGPPQ